MRDITCRSIPAIHVSKAARADGLERLPYVHRVHAAKGFWLDIAEIVAESGAGGDERPLMEQLAADERAVDVPRDRAKEAHGAASSDRSARRLWRSR